MVGGFQIPRVKLRLRVAYKLSKVRCLFYLGLPRYTHTDKQVYGLVRGPYRGETFNQIFLTFTMCSLQP